MSTENNLTVLVVDDSDIIRHSLKSFFNDYNIDVITSHDGLEGIQKAIQYKPNLILLDLMMPNFDGVKMLQVIRLMDDLKTIPVFVISGNTNRSNVMAVIEAGAEKIITKPLQKDVILKNIKEVLGNDFLSRTKKSKVFSESESKQVVEHMKKIFIKSYPAKRETMNKALERKDKELLRSIVHQVKGEGGTIGVSLLTDMCANLELDLEEELVDWIDINLRVEQINSLVSKLEKKIAVTTG